MSEDGVTAAALAVRGTGHRAVLVAGDVPVGAVSGRGAAGRRVAPARPGWWQAWRARFGLAEVCGTIAAIGGFTAGYLATGSLLAAAGLATICEGLGFYGCVGVKAAAAACRATAHLGGLRRLAAGAWHAITQQLASCAAAEALDGLAVRPGCLAGAAWLARPLPGGVWLGFAVGKAAADVAWYAMEASARRGMARGAAAGQSASARRGMARGAAAAQRATPYLLLDLARARDCFAALAAALPGVSVHYAVKANPHPKLLACLHAAGCRFEAASWAEVRAAIRAG